MENSQTIDILCPIHVLKKHFKSGSKPEILGYFDNVTYASLAWHYEVERWDEVRQVWYELKPEYEYKALLPI